MLSAARLSDSYASLAGSSVALGSLGPTAPAGVDGNLPRIFWISDIGERTDVRWTKDPGESDKQTDNHTDEHNTPPSWSALKRRQHWMVKDLECGGIASLVHLRHLETLHKQK